MNIICNDESLIDLLQADDNDSMRETAEHVEQCSHCQSRIELLAADHGEWELARNVLPSSKSREMPSHEIDDEDYGREWTLRRERSTNWTDSMAKSLLSPPSHPEMMGRIGRYGVERLIGSGGMGVVFKAYDTELNRPVAVKLLAPYLAQNGSARKRFAREARAAAAVVDEHVVAIHNVESGDDPEEPPFLVMKYIAGGSLQQRLDRDGPLDVCEILRIGMQTAKGLAAAHAQGLIHRDVKPSNILLDEGVERALLTDFGLARAEDDACLTRSGFHPGTPHYMSPEQVRGEAIDGRSDLFSLGCVLYALCAGHPPFRAETSYAVLRRITDDTARPIRELNPNIPEWLEQIVMKSLSKSREDRFESAEEVAELLEDCLAHVQHPTTTPLPDCVAALPPRRSSRPPWFKWIAAAAFAFIALAGTIIFLETGKGTIRIETNSETDVPIVIRQGDEVVDHLTVSKDGATSRLKAGKYIIEVEGDVTKFAIKGGEFRLARGDTWIATISEMPQEHAGMGGLDGDGKMMVPPSGTSMNGETLGMKYFPRPRSPSDLSGSFVPGKEAMLPPYFAPIPDQPNGSRPITEVIDQFNRQMAATTQSDWPLPHAHRQPPLTVDELLCCCRWTLETDEDLVSETRQMLTEIGIGRRLPEQWAIEGGGCQIASTDGWMTDVYLVALVSRNSDSKVIVRKRYLAPPEQFRSVTLPQTGQVTSAIPLAAALTEFNAIHKSVDGIRHPPLTINEVLAAIVDANAHRTDFPVDNTTFANLQQIARTHQLPPNCKLDVIPGFGTQSGEMFKIWSIRIVMPQTAKPDWTYAFEVRKQYVSVDSPGDSMIHWGKPNDWGLQAGFRLIPSQHTYQVGQPIKTEFFYRSISGKPISATLPNVFSHRELIAKDGTGKLLEVVEVRDRTIGGALQTKIEEVPTRKQGQPLRLSLTTPIPASDFSGNHPPETNLTVTLGRKIILQYNVTDFNGGTLSTSQLAIEIADTTQASTALREMASTEALAPEPSEVINAVEKQLSLEHKELVELYVNNRNDFQIEIKQIVGESQEARFFPTVGRASLQRAHFKCTVRITADSKLSWPGTQSREPQVVYITSDTLIPVEAPAEVAAGRPDLTFEEVDRIESPDLGSVCSVVISPDGKHLYAAARDACNLLVYRQDDGQSEPHTKLVQKIHSEENLEGALGLRVTPDGKHVVVTAFRSKTVCLYARDPKTGELTEKHVARDGQDGVIGLHWAFDCEVSPDSRFVYATSSHTDRDASRLPEEGEGNVTVFEIAGDKLRWVQTLTNSHDTFDGAVHITAHPSGDWLFVANYRSNAVVMLGRDQKTGKVTLSQAVYDSEELSLDGVYGVRCSSDGKYLYASSGRFRGEHGVTVFELAPQDYAGGPAGPDILMEPIQSIRGGTAELPDFAGGNRVLASHDGLRVYVMGSLSGTLAAFDRYPKSGKLTEATITRVTSEDEGLGPASICESKDGAYIYAAAQDHSSIIVLQRQAQPNQAAAKPKLIPPSTAVEPMPKELSQPAEAVSTQDESDKTLSSLKQ